MTDKEVKVVYDFHVYKEAIKKAEESWKQIEPKIQKLLNSKAK